MAYNLESLDPRRLLSSYSTADYYPFVAGDTWKYSVVDDGVAGTSTTTTMAATFKGKPVLAFVDSEKTDSNSTSTEYQTFSRTKGVRLLADFEVDSTERLDVVGETAFLPGTLSIGSSTTFPPAAVTIRLRTDNFDANGTGTANVSVSPKAVGSITTDSGLIFNDVIKVSTHAIISYSLKSSAFKGSGKIDVTDTSYYARGVGRVKSISLGTQAITINGQSATEKVNMTELLTSASRVGLDAKVLNGVLAITGSSGDDHIDVSLTDKGVLVTGDRVSMLFKTSAVKSISIVGGAGNDAIVVGGGLPAARIDAGDGNDIVKGGEGNDIINGGAGKNTIYGRNGDDRLDGGKGPDKIFGGNGNDRLAGSGGNDLLDGGDGSDLIFGGVGDDLLLGGPGHDSLFGEAGNDTLKGQAHADALNGGDGIDSAESLPGDTASHIEKFL